jgi:FkbM family methyltransferase
MKIYTKISAQIVKYFNKFLFLLKYRANFFEKNSLIAQAKFIDDYYKYDGRRGNYKIKFRIDKKTKGVLRTPWLPMLRVQLRSFFIFKEYMFDLKQDPVIIDAGANIGIGSIYFSKIYKPSKLYSIEADPTILNKYLIPNLNSYKVDSTVINKALWSKSDSHIEFITTGIDNGHIKEPKNTNITENNPYEIASLIKIETIKLDDILDECGFCDLLKIDIEGAEFEVLFNTKNLAKVGNLHVEVEYQKLCKKNYTKLIDYLEQLGFEVFIRSTLKTSVPKDLIKERGIVMYIHIIAIRK